MKEITYDNDLFERYYKEWASKRKNLLKKRTLDEIKEIVIHHTAGNGDWPILKNWMLNGERQKNYKKGVGLFHFCIEKKGKIINSWPLDQPVFHSSCYLHDLETIGIEVIHKYGEFTQPQYDSLVRLCNLLISKCDIKRITTHDYNYLKYSKKTKGCPGKMFKWAELEKYLSKKGIKFTSNGKNLIELDEKYELTELDKVVIVDSGYKESSIKQIEGRIPLWLKLLQPFGDILKKYLGSLF